MSGAAGPGPAVLPAPLHIYCDESGNTGVDLLNAEQPFFALAATSMSAEECRQLVAPLLRQKQKEAKYARLKGTASGQKALLDFFSSPLLAPDSTKVMAVDKLYYVITHIVDKLIEPPVYEGGEDLYAGDAHVGLVNIWYYGGRRFFPRGHWDRVLRAFVAALRLRNAAAYADFDRVLLAAANTSPSEDKDFVTGLMLARGRLPEFIGVFGDLVVFDPAVDMFIDMINKWMVEHPGMINVTHDRSKPLKRNEQFLRMMMKPLPPRWIGYGERRAELPLRVATFDFGDSVGLPQLQLSDLVAGAAVDWVRAVSSRQASSGYIEALANSRLKELLVAGMLPSLDVERRNEPLPGQVSLVDGSSAFLQEAGLSSKD